MPKGLYPLPRHHQYGGKPRVVSLNSNHFSDDFVNDFKTKDMPKPVESRPDNHKQESLGKAEYETPKKDKKDKKRKKKSIVSGDIDATEIVQSDDMNFTTPDKAKSEKKQKKQTKAGKKLDESGKKPYSSKKEKKKEPEKQENQAQVTETVNSEPKKKRKRKRKRDSEADALTELAVRNDTAGDNGLFPDDEFVQQIADLFAGDNAVKTLSPEKPEVPEKKKRKSSAKKQKIQSEAERDGISANATQTPSKSPKVKKLKSAVNESLNTKEDPGAQSTAMHSAPSVAATSSIATAPSPTKQPKFSEKTPIPPPKNSALLSSSQPVQLQKNENILVPETPPSQRSRKSNKAFNLTPVPFKLYQQDGSASVGRPLFSTPSFQSSGATPMSAPAAITKGKMPVPVPSVPNALTNANLTKHTGTEPLNDDPKPRPRAKGASSAAESTGSSLSIKDMFARASKRQSKGDMAEDDPIVDQLPSKAPKEKQKELSMNKFNTQFTELQSSIDFINEQNYLEEYLNWDHANADNALPCLGKATGCTSKKEEILRLSREENLDLLSHMDGAVGMEGINPDVLHKAGAGARNAEELLMLSIRASVPVPIGSLEGTWTLYCPKYAESHFDRYGYGQRTLIISRIAGFNHRHSYTARLKVPPRTMLYSVLGFQTPPHASFRATVIQTSSEGYNMEVIFLGNGYLTLRVDLMELLQGRPKEKVDGKQSYMEFIGVHENAVNWWNDKDTEDKVSKRVSEGA
ncbi:unnamed protein product [Periconia digitata]|uniref:Uncharacterized protein n=1 Tax=Periconia digitata TaxID=1303443 RepID=A0A9W4UTR3_9PLEO|nr:unnamed protein product [Periconia digitata]